MVRPNLCPNLCPNLWRSDVRRLAVEDHAEALEHVRRHLVAPTLRAQNGLQLALEVRVTRARVAGHEVLLDLDAQAAFELPVKVELEAPEDLFAVNR
jgi:hypothetical protein